MDSGASVWTSAELAAADILAWEWNKDLINERASSLARLVARPPKKGEFQNVKSKQVSSRGPD